VGDSEVLELEEPDRDKVRVLFGEREAKAVTDWVVELEMEGVVEEVIV